MHKPPGSPLLNAWGGGSLFHTACSLAHQACSSGITQLSYMQLYFCILCPHYFVFPYTVSSLSPYLVYPPVIDRMSYIHLVIELRRIKAVKWCGWRSSFRLVPWLPVTRLLSLKLEFIFYKLKWNVFVFQAIISILLSSHLRLMKRAHQTLFHANEAAQAGWLLPFTVRHLLK